MRFSAVLSLLLIGGVCGGVSTSVLPSISSATWAQESGAQALEASETSDGAQASAAAEGASNGSAPARRDVETVVPASDERAPAGAPIAFEKRGGAFLGADWLADFATPPREFRPLQIVQSRVDSRVKPFGARPTEPSAQFVERSGQLDSPMIFPDAGPEKESRFAQIAAPTVQPRSFLRRHRRSLLSLFTPNLLF